MPSCFKCSADNVSGSKYCVACGALLPQMAPTGAPNASSMDLDEKTQYLTPQHHYPSEELLNLAWTANDFIEGEAPDLDNFLDAYESVKHRFETYRANAMDGFLDSIADDRAREPEDPYPKQLGYLHTKAVSLYEEGIAIIEAFLDAFENDDFDTEQLKNGVVKMVMANDHFCLAFELVQARITVIQNNLNELGFSINDEGEPIRTRVPAASSDDEAAEEPVGAEAGSDGE